jgi:hypothetical protein
MKTENIIPPFIPEAQDIEDIEPQPIQPQKKLGFSLPIPT